MEITIKVGGSFIKLDAGGVKIIGPNVKLNSGGCPGNGSSVVPLLPGLVKHADTEKAGELLNPAQTQTIKRTPFCEQCERAAEEATP